MSPPLEMIPYIRQTLLILMLPTLTPTEMPLSFPIRAPLHSVLLSFYLLLLHEPLKYMNLIQIFIKYSKSK